MRTSTMLITCMHALLQVYSDIVDPTNDALPNVLRKPKTFEVNCSAQFTTFIVNCFAHFDEKDNDSLRVGDGFRLYHSQAESFIQASCNADKDEKGAVVREKVNGTNYPHGHIPYLKGLADLGDDPDPSNPINQVHAKPTIFPMFSPLLHTLRAPASTVPPRLSLFFTRAKCTHKHA